MITLRTLIISAVIATSLSFISGHASAEANFDSVLANQPQAINTAKIVKTKPMDRDIVEWVRTATLMKQGRIS